MKHTLTINGPHCNSCIMLITDSLAELGVKDIKMNLNEKKKQATLACTYAGKREDIIAAIKNEGYEVAL